MNVIPPLKKSRLRILAILKEGQNDGGMKLEEVPPLLLQQFNKTATSSVVLACIHDLKHMGLVSKNGEKYTLTARGLAHVTFLQENQPDLFRKTLSPEHPMHV